MNINKLPVEKRRFSEAPQRCTGLRVNRPRGQSRDDFKTEEFELEALRSGNGRQNGRYNMRESVTIETMMASRETQPRTNRFLSIAPNHFAAPPALSVTSVRSDIGAAAPPKSPRLRGFSLQPNGLMLGRGRSQSQLIEQLPLPGNKKVFQNRKEKSTGILVGIILVFFLCHVFRLSIQVSFQADDQDIFFGSFELILIVPDLRDFLAYAWTSRSFS